MSPPLRNKKIKTSLNKITNRNNALFFKQTIQFLSSKDILLMQLTTFTFYTIIEVITPKIYKAELWFLCMKHCLIVLYKCIKFRLNSFSSCQVTERTRNSIANDQREIT